MSQFTNPEAFQFEAAHILAAAYEKFPLPFGWIHDEECENYPTTAANTRKDIQFHTIKWLCDHGYLDDKFGFVAGEWKGLRLSNLGIHALNRVPDALEGKATIGERIGKAVKTGSLEVIRVLIGTAIEGAIGA